MILKENERIDDLQINNLKIIQNSEWFCFGIDSVLLSDFAKEIHKNSKIIDLGTGTGILPLLLSAKIENSNITGIEVQKEVADMAKRSIELNNLKERIQIINSNIKDIEYNMEFDAVVTNPPYKEKNTGLINENNIKLISRHEVEGNLEDFIKISSRVLKDKGAMYMVNRPERIVDIFEYCRKYRLEPKELKFVYSKIKSVPTLILIKAVKNAKKYLKVDKPLYIYKDNGDYTDEILKIYNKIK